MYRKLRNMFNKKQMDTIEYWKRQWNSVTEDRTFVTDTNDVINNIATNRIFPGRYYSINGYWLGDVEGNYEDIYIADNVQFDMNQKMVKAENSKLLSIKYNKLRDYAATVYGESSAAYMSELTDDLRCEMSAIAEVLRNNEKAYGSNLDKAKEYRKLTPCEINDLPFKRTANAVVINALLLNEKESRFSYGADMWDGEEQSHFDESVNERHLKYNNKSIELHMNTMGWRILDEHYIKWKNNVGSKFKAPQVKVASYGDNKGKIRLQSTAVYCKTIFWNSKGNKKDKDEK